MSCPGLWRDMSSGALKVERSGSGARPTRTARSQLSFRHWPGGRRAPGDAPNVGPAAVSQRRIYDSCSQPVDCHAQMGSPLPISRIRWRSHQGGGMLGTGVEEVKVGGVSTSGETGGGIAA